MKNTGLSRGESLEMGVDGWLGEFGKPRFQAIYRFLSTTCGGTMCAMADRSNIILPEQTKVAPVLSNGRVSPSSGDPTTFFAYCVNYTDADNDTPVCASVIIDGMTYGMVTFDTNYSHGASFAYFTTMQGGTHDYSFDFSDGDVRVRLPESGTFNGPQVEIPVKPTISYGIVLPANGTTDTLFRYMVYYNDSNDDPPIIYNVIIDGIEHEMITNSTDYKNGCEYIYDTKLTFRNHSYCFFFADKTGSVLLPETGTLLGPEVKARNYPPVLSNGLVTPISGSHGLDFTFSVEYEDSDGDDASNVIVYIRPLLDGNDNQSENWTGGGDFRMVSTDGHHFTCSTRLTPGNWSFKFSASDGSIVIQFPGSYLPGPLVKNGAPSARIQEGNGPFYIRDGIALELNAGGSSDPDMDPLAFRWDLDGGAESFVGSRIFFISSLGEHDLTLNVSDPYGLFDIISIKITIIRFSARISIAEPVLDSATFKEGRRVNWSVTVSNEGDAFSEPTNLTWILDGLEVRTIPVPSIQPGKTVIDRWGWDAVSGNHTVIARIGFIENSSRLNVVANIPPIAIIDFPGDILVNKAALFSATGSADSDGILISYVWDFGDGETAEGIFVNHTYISSGTFTVNLMVVDDNRDLGTTTVNVTVKSMPISSTKGFIPGASGIITCAVITIMILLRVTRWKPND